jgi:tetratricopeptide (TPR) repeat protein
MAKWLKNLWSKLSGSQAWDKSFDEACTLYKAGDYTAAETIFRTTIALAEQSNNKQRMFTTLACMGSCLRSLEKFDEAEVLFRKAINDYAKDCPVDDLAFVYKELGVCLYEAGQAATAEEPLISSMELYATLNMQQSEDTADCAFFLARALILQGKFEQSLKPLEHSMTIYLNSPETRAAEIADTLHCQAVVWNRMEEFEKAEANLAKAAPLHEQLFGKDSIEAARCTTEWATAVLSQGRFGEAEDLLRQVLSSLSGIDARNSVDYADSLTALGTCCRLQKRSEEAAVHFEEALRLYQNGVGAADPADIAAVLTQLAVCHTDTDDCNGAEPYFRKALEVTESLEEPKPHILSDNLYNLAKCSVFQKRYAEAISLYKRALDILETKGGKEEPELAPILTELAYCYQLQDRIAEAKPLYLRAQQIYETNKAEDDDMADNLIGLANCYLETGEYSRARPLYQRALEYKQFKFDPKDQDLASKIEDLLKQMEHSAV